MGVLRGGDLAIGVSGIDIAALDTDRGDSVRSSAGRVCP